MRELHNQGFVLPAAIFLLVVLGSLAAWMMQLTVATQAQDALAIEGERAYRAAEAGLEAGIYAARQDTPVCATQTLNMFTGQLSRFTAHVICTDTVVNEGGSVIHLFQITSIACNQPATTGDACPNSIPTSPEYAERQLQATVESGS
jgi:MSHA biogenesis protein MshP